MAAAQDVERYLLQRRAVAGQPPLLTGATAQLDRWVGPWFQARCRSRQRAFPPIHSSEPPRPLSARVQRLASDAAALREETDDVLARLRDFDDAAPSGNFARLLGASPSALGRSAVAVLPEADSARYALAEGAYAPPRFVAAPASAHRAAGFSLKMRVPAQARERPHCARAPLASLPRPQLATFCTSSTRSAEAASCDPLWRRLRRQRRAARAGRISAPPLPRSPSPLSRW